MSWKNILKAYDPQFGITGDPVHDITDHTQHPGKEVYGSAGNVNLLDSREVDIERMINVLTEIYGPGWTSLALSGADEGDYIILRDKQ